MGKTTLAVAALHKSEVVGKYPNRHFIPCDSAQTNESLQKPFGHWTTLPGDLDNFETPWEPMDGRAKVEGFLSLLADILHLALLITMRGAERPGKVRWTHPFLYPLVPLTRVAAYQTFIEIADDIHNNSEVDQLLDITDNIPLAVQLIASIADSEGCGPTLERWKLEKTAMLSDGTNKRSNLEHSIQLSLSSPRMVSSPYVVELLRLMSLLSDGRLKVLAPIREYIRNTQPPSPRLVLPLQKHFIELLKLWKTVMDSPLFGLDFDEAAHGETMRGIILLNDFNLVMDRGLNPLMLRLPEMLNQMDDPNLHGKFIAATFRARHFYKILDPDKSMCIAVEHFRMVKDLEGEALLHTAAGKYYLHCVGDLKKARSFYNHALSLASQCHSDEIQVRALVGLVLLEVLGGNYREGLRLSQTTHRIAVAAGIVWGELSSCRWLAICYQGLGDFKRSLQLTNDGKELVVRLGMEGSQIESHLMNIEAEVYLVKGEYTTARHIHEFLLQQTSAVLSPIQHASALVNIAFLDMTTGVSAEIVTRKLDTATSIFRKARDMQGLATCEACRTDLQLREGDILGARNEYIRLFSALQSSHNELSCLCLAKLADPIYPVHADKEGRKMSGRNIPAMHHALRCLGDVFAQQGMDDEALSILMVALEGFTHMDMHRGRAECMRTIGDISMRSGNLRVARDTWTAAQSLFERAEQTRDFAGIEERLMFSAEKSSRRIEDKQLESEETRRKEALVERCI
ncbi:hypothetical protein B0H14DRAFT_2746184 [Mycena olivaceomarginata]|nr:hypothetical protein B0H14DRAFT_2746184 [Mycena olivaceomarginata]